jgi:hypothetical protein
MSHSSCTKLGKESLPNPQTLLILIGFGGVLTVFGQGLKAQLTLVNAPVSSGAISFPQIQ